MSTVLQRASMKSALLTPLEGQKAFWENVFRSNYPEIYVRMQWDVNQLAIESLNCLDISSSDAGFYRIALVPNILEAFGGNQDPVFSDLRQANIFKKFSCQIFGVEFWNECVMKGERMDRILIKKGGGWEPFYQTCREQKTGLIALRVQYGQTQPCIEDSSDGLPPSSSLKKGEFHVPLGLAFSIIAPQNPKIVWGIEQERWIGGAGSVAASGFGEWGKYHYPCLNFCKDLDAVEVISIHELLSFETDPKKKKAREHQGGYMTAIAPL